MGLWLTLRTSIRLLQYQELGFLEREMNWSYITLLQDRSLSAPNFENTLIIAIKQGGTAEAVIGGVIKTIDSIIDYNLFFIAKQSPWRKNN